LSYKPEEVDLSALEELEIIDPEILKEYEVKSEGTEPAGVKMKSAQLEYKSDTRIVFNFTIDNEEELGEYIFTIDGTRVTPIYEDGTWQVKKENITARQLDRVYELEVSREGDPDSRKITYGAPSYWYSRIKKSESEATKKACMAMYWYNKAAHEYFD
jgi:hypothetical protein